MLGRLASLSGFLRFSSLAGFLLFWWQSAGLLFGTDAAARSAAILGLCLSLSLAPWIVSFGKRRIWDILFGVGWALCFAIYLPITEHWTFSSGGGSFLWLTALHAAAFAPAAPFLRRSLDENLPKLPLCILGLAAGVFVQEALLLPSVGWFWSQLFWAALLVFASSIPDASTAEQETESAQWLSASCAALWGILAGSGLILGKVFLAGHLSSTRYGSTAVLGTILFGLGIGALLAATLAPKMKNWQRAAAVPVASGAALWVTMATLATLAATPLSGLHQSLQSFSLGLGELFLCVQALGFSTVLLGAAWHAARPRGFSLSLLLLAFGVGSLAGPNLLGPELVDAFIPHRPGDKVFERRATEEGILRRVRAVAEGHSATVYWNRDPLSRQPEWIPLEQEEVFLPARLHPSASRALIVGTPFGSHRTAVSVAGVPQVDFADPIPSFLEETDGKGPNARSLQTGRYDWIAVLSSPSLLEGRGLWLTEDFFLRAAAALRTGGSLVVWAELRALPQEEIATLLRSFTTVFPKTRLWLGQDLYAGPLLGLDSGAVAITPLHTPGLVHLVAEGDRLRDLVGKGPVSTLLRPRLECSAPLLPSPRGLPHAAQLRSFASLLAPRPEQRTGLFYLLDSLAIHAEEQTPASIFASRLDRIGVTQEEVEQASIGIELHPDFLPLHRHLAAMGQLLLDKRDYQNALRFFPRWSQAVPENREFLMLVAQTHHDLLDDALALPYAEKAVALDSNRAEAHELLGDTQAGLKLWKEAVVSYSTAAMIRPEAPRLAKKLGLAHLELGELSPARDWLSRALVGLPGDKDINAALERIGGR